MAWPSPTSTPRCRQAWPSSMPRSPAWAVAPMPRALPAMWLRRTSFTYWTAWALKLASIWLNWQLSATGFPAPSTARMAPRPAGPFAPLAPPGPCEPFLRRCRFSETRPATRPVGGQGNGPDGRTGRPHAQAGRRLRATVGWSRPTRLGLLRWPGRRPARPDRHQPPGLRQRPSGPRAVRHGRRHQPDARPQPGGARLPGRAMQLGQRLFLRDVRRPPAAEKAARHGPAGRPDPQRRTATGALFFRPDADRTELPARGNPARPALQGAGRPAPHLSRPPRG